MAGVPEVVPAVTVTSGKGTPPVAFYEAVWHEPQLAGGRKPAKQRIGRAWLDFAGHDDRGRAQWTQRRGRVPDGYFDLRRAHAAAPGAVHKYRNRQAERQRTPSIVETITVRERPPRSARGSCATTRSRTATSASATTSCASSCTATTWRHPPGGELDTADVVIALAAGDLDEPTFIDWVAERIGHH